MATIVMYQDDKDYEVVIPLDFYQGDSFDISGATCYFKAQKYGESALAWTIQTSNVNDAEQTATFEMGTILVGIAIGEYRGEVQVELSGGSVLTIKHFTIKILGDLPK